MTSVFRKHGVSDFNPVKGSEYFTNHYTIPINCDKFHYYTRGERGPVIVALHGGGYSALTWALFARHITSKVECRIIAIDLRGHGNSETTIDDMSLKNLTQDVRNIITNLFPTNMPPIVLIGHSLGGAIAVELAPLLQTIVGLCIIDVVEGTALDSLSVMQSVIKGRPTSFKSIEQAIQWSVRSGCTTNANAARVSTPGQIKNLKTGMLAAEEVESEVYVKGEVATDPEEGLICGVYYSISEDLEDNPDMSPQSQEVPKNYGWRIDLAKTEKYWPGWFKGLSQKFLNIPEPKILLMANIYGLDTELTVGQMQGKFQLQVLPRAGHAIQEDQPEQVANIVATFIIKQALGVAVEGFKPIVPGY